MERGAGGEWTSTGAGGAWRPRAFHGGASGYNAPRRRVPAASLSELDALSTQLNDEWFEHLTFQTKLYLQHQRMQQVKLQLEHKPYTKRYLEQKIGCAYTVKEQPLRSIWGLGTLFFLITSP